MKKLASKHWQAPRPAIPNHPVYQSPRYHRRGVLHLMAVLSVADGQVLGQCHARKRKASFRSFLETVVVPEAMRRRVQTRALVLDNGPTHASKQLPQWTKELAYPLNVSGKAQLVTWFCNMLFRQGWVPIESKR